MHKYEVIIYWSEEDRSFIAEIPQLPGCAAHGETHEVALTNVNSAVELWIAVAKEFGDVVPPPVGRRLSTLNSGLIN
jgi:predicted RNase H-like HicB family nuclease